MHHRCADASLKVSDIQIADDGTAVKISDLRLVTGSGGHWVTLVFDKLESASANRSRSPRPPPPFRLPGHSRGLAQGRHRTRYGLCPVAS